MWSKESGKTLFHVVGHLQTRHCRERLQNDKAFNSYCFAQKKGKSQTNIKTLGGQKVEDPGH
jgi:hypothetical protein